MKKPKHLLEVKIAIASKGDRRMSIGRQSGRRKGDIEKITIQEEEGKEQEVAVGHEAAPPKESKLSCIPARIDCQQIQNFLRAEFSEWLTHIYVIPV